MGAGCGRREFHWINCAATKSRLFRASVDLENITKTYKERIQLCHKFPIPHEGEGHEHFKTRIYRFWSRYCSLQ